MNKTSQRFTLQSQQPLNQEKQQKQSAQQRLIKSSDIDALLKKILHQKDPQQEIKFTEEEIKCVCLAVREHFLAQSSLLRLIAPIKIVGDIHGQFPDLIKIFKKNGFPSEQQQTRYLFLGDYVDRGKQSIECVMLLFAYMLKYPQCVFMLRGNHESAQVNKLYGFWDECKRRYSLKVWKYFVDCFNCMPVCALIQDRILCMHGGLSPQLTKVKKIELLHRPTQIPPSGLLCDLLWSDPVQDKKGWNDNNERGISKLFGPDVLQKFLQVNDLDLICRAHQVISSTQAQIVEQGYEFFGKKQLVTIFSAPNYCGQFENSGAVMNVGKELVCSFNVLKSEIHGKIEDGKKKKTVPKYIN